MTYTEAGSTTAQPFLDLAAQQRPLKHIPSADAANSSALDSRRVWKRVTDALLAGDFGTASKEKTLLEEAQRARRKEREERGEEWKPHYFEWRSPTGNGPPGSAPVSPVQEQSAASATASTTTSPVKVSVTDEGSRSWGNIFSRKSGAATSSTSSIGSKKTTSSRSAAPASVSTVALDEGWVFRRELRTFE